MFSLKKFSKSLKYAGKGILLVFREEQNFRLQAAAGAVVLFLAWYFHLPVWQWIVLILVISFVLVLELINSIFERVIDIVKPGIDDYVRAIKDIMAGAVFIASIVALIVGILIFAPLF